MLTMTPPTIFWADSHETLEDLAYKRDPFYRASERGSSMYIRNGRMVSEFCSEEIRAFDIPVNIASIDEDSGFPGYWEQFHYDVDASIYACGFDWEVFY